MPARIKPRRTNSPRISPRLRAECQPDADFAPPLRYGVRDHAVDAEMPSSSAIAPAIASITSVNDVCAIDWS